MNARKIVAAAAVMTLQAVVMAMTSPTAQAATVYRCQDGPGAAGVPSVHYQSVPCASSQAERTLKVADAPARAADRPGITAAQEPGKSAKRRRGRSGKPEGGAQARTGGQRPSRDARQPQAVASRVASAAPAMHGHPTSHATQAAKGTRAGARPRPAHAGALTRHRLGERPFEHLGQEVTPPERERRRQARAPAPTTREQSSSRGVGPVSHGRVNRRDAD